MIRLWAAAKSLQIPVKAGVLEAICLEQTWPLSLIEKLSASIFLSVQELVLHMFPPAPSLCHSFSCTHHHCQSSSLYTISLLFFICHSSFIFFSLPLPVSFSLLLPLSLSLQAAREKENSQAQLKALSQQTEAARRELAEILGRLAQREEELHRKDVELSETHQRQLSLQQEIREVWGPTPR